MSWSRSLQQCGYGTLWPSDPQECRDFVLRNKIGSIQFSFDGLAKNHNNRRHFKDGNRRHEVSSFDALCRTVEALRGIVKQYLRLNLDKGNKDDVQELVEYFSVRREKALVHSGKERPARELVRSTR